MNPPPDGVDRPPVLLFDVMDTLVDDPFFKVVPDFFGMSLHELIAQKHPTAWIEFESGFTTEAEFIENFFTDGRPVDSVRLKRCVHEAYRWKAGMQQLVEELHAARVEMHTLSNYSNWYHTIEQQLEISRFVQWTFVSCDTGLRKPDPQAYLHAAHALDVRPDRCVFIDDREVNVRAARDVGMRSILMIDADQIRREIASIFPGQIRS